MKRSSFLLASGGMCLKVLNLVVMNQTVNIIPNLPTSGSSASKQTYVPAFLGFDTKEGPAHTFFRSLDHAIFLFMGPELFTANGREHFTIGSSNNTAGTQEGQSLQEWHQMLSNTFSSS